MPGNFGGILASFVIDKVQVIQKLFVLQFVYSMKIEITIK